MNPNIKMTKRKETPHGDKAQKKAITKRFLSCFVYIIVAVLFIFLLFLYPSYFKTEDTVVKNKDLNVLLITIDTIRADRVGYSGYDIETPHLDSLAHGGARFMNAICQVPLTLPSHASILTGTNPPFHQIKNNGTYYLKESFKTLTEILKEKGYQTAAFIGAFPLDSQFGLDQGFDIYDDEFRNPDHLKGYEPQRVAEQVYDPFASWFELKADKEFFVWVHYYDPHLPYTPPSPFDTKYSSSYDGEIAYTDVYVGKLVELLKEKGIYEETLIIVVGDHGEGLGDHREDTHGIFLYDTTLKVPLLFHSPSVIPKGLEINKQVRTIDIFPTILEILEIDVPEFCQGLSLIPLMEGKNLEIESYGETYLPLLACGWSELKALRTNKWKFIQAPKPELYDLENDPFEENNLIEKEVAHQLKKKLKEIEKKISSPEDKEPFKRLTPEEQEKLAALGYIGGTGFDKINKQSNIDAKDKIHIFEEILKAELSLSKGEPEKAEEILKKLVAQEPENPMIHHFLGKAYQKLEEWDKSIEEFKKALRISQDDIYSNYFLAVSYYKTGRKEEAIREAKIVLSFLGKHFNSLLLLADIYGSSGDYKDSAMYLQRAIKIEPDNLNLRLLYADYLTLAKEYDEAFAEYRHLLDKTPGNPEVYHNLGMLCYFKNDFEKAIKYFLKEIELRIDPNSYFFLGIAYGKLDKYKEAISYLEKYLDSLPLSEIEKRKKAESAILFFKSKLP